MPVIAGGAVGAFVLTGATPSSAAYRTAKATTGDVTQTLTTTGAIESASQEDVSFQVAGTVDEVSVAVGDTVEAGQLLATLDTDDLDDAVTEAEEALADAEEALADDLEAQSSDSSSSASSVSYSTPSSSTLATFTTVAAVTAGAASAVTAATADATTTDAVEQARAALVEAQEALLAQYDTATALLAEANQAAADAQTICAAFTDASGGDTDGGDTDGGDTDGGDTGEARDVESDLADALAACQDATATALEASAASMAAQDELMNLAVAVDEALAAYQQALADAGGSTDPDTGGSTGPDTGGSTDPDAGGSTGPDAGGVTGDGAGDGGGDQSGSGGLDAGGGGNGSGSAGAGGGMAGEEETVPSAADILADKAEITAAEAALTVAQQQLEYATISAPVAGEVVSVTMAAGDEVSASSTDAVITLVADNAYLVSLSVSLTEVQLLAVGQEAQVTLSSTGDVVDGVVASVSNVNSGNSFSQSYAVTVAIPDPGFDIRIGAATRMQITVAGSSDVLVVPTSAVTDAAGDATVQVLAANGTVSEVAIVTGAIGSVYTEVASGIEQGDEVVLADLSLEITSEETEESESRGLLSGLNEEDSDGGDMQMPGGGQMPGRGGQMPSGGGPGA
ncbi:efflux RND transporter periplasmic adaptor subunit [Demequina sp.]|uniref:efflux RND transporter periplasmic adaptor subunit n=1 Tax=Demequina sp. TaxID=2050685 RepID=UPI003A85C8D5